MEEIQFVTEEVAIETVTVYLDEKLRCHLQPADGLVPFETSFFVGRLEIVPLYRAIPEGQIWIRADGAVFAGEMIAPIPAAELAAEQGA